MSYDQSKIDEAALALIGAFSWNESGQHRAWKTIDFDITDRLHERGLIADPRGSSKSFVLTAAGVAAAQAAAARLFNGVK